MIGLLGRALIGWRTNRRSSRDLMKTMRRNRKKRRKGSWLHESKIGCIGLTSINYLGVMPINGRLNVKGLIILVRRCFYHDWRFLQECYGTLEHRV